MSPATAPALGGGRFRRLLVVFDPAFENMPAVDSVAQLAARMEAELMGLFIEDEDLLRAAGYPGASTVSVLSATRSSLDAAVLRRALKAQAEASRQNLERAARARQIKTSFEVRQGRLQTEVLALSEDVDLVVVDWSCGEFLMRAAGGRRERPGAIARAIAEAVRRPVLLLRKGANLSGAVLVAYDGSPAANEALELGIELAEHDGGTVEVVFLTESLVALRDWQEAVSSRVRGRPVVALYHYMPHPDLNELYREARRQHATLMVLEASLPLLEGAAAQKLLSHMDCSVLLVR